jgi:cation transport protein ChaC
MPANRAAPASPRNAAAGDLWVFGYGSLMWNPGFPHVASAPALLRGYHRAFCVYSVHHRGTPERPGLVLGLDHGGACRGRAFLVAAADVAGVIAYLDKREMVTRVYRPRRVPIAMADGSAVAHTYVIDRGHAQYARGLTFDETLGLIAGGNGVSGNNVDYLASTVAHLDELGIAGGPLHALLRVLQG